MKQTTLDALTRYVEEKLPTGNFLYSVLTNNLRDSFAYADDENKRDLEEIVRYCHNQIPGRCWGSVEKVTKWLGERRIEGR